MGLRIIRTKVRRKTQVRFWAKTETYEQFIKTAKSRRYYIQDVFEAMMEKFIEDYGSPSGLEKGK